MPPPKVGPKCVCVCARARVCNGNAYPSVSCFKMHPPWCFEFESSSGDMSDILLLCCLFCCLNDGYSWSCLLLAMLTSLCQCLHSRISFL